MFVIFLAGLEFEAHSKLLAILASFNAFRMHVFDTNFFIVNHLRNTTSKCTTRKPPVQKTSTRGPSLLPIAVTTQQDDAGAPSPIHKVPEYSLKNCMQVMRFLLFQGNVTGGIAQW